ncbi:hypothetical protein Pelo_9641 [Pelomyxa schiedti]|nr:hypothetical protein Pelo_9641 [Pelomyxa schiedti]
MSSDQRPTTTERSTCTTATVQGERALVPTLRFQCPPLLNETTMLPLPAQLLALCMINHPRCGPRRGGGRCDLANGGADLGLAARLVCEAIMGGPVRFFSVGVGTTGGHNIMLRGPGEGRGAIWLTFQWFTAVVTFGVSTVTLGVVPCCTRVIMPVQSTGHHLMGANNTHVIDRVDKEEPGGGTWSVKMREILSRDMEYPGTGLMGGFEGENEDEYKVKLCQTDRMHLGLSHKWLVHMEYKNKLIVVNILTAQQNPQLSAESSPTTQITLPPTWNVQKIVVQHGDEAVLVCLQPGGIFWLNVIALEATCSEGRLNSISETRITLSPPVYGDDILEVHSITRTVTDRDLLLTQLCDSRYCLSYNHVMEIWDCNRTDAAVSVVDYTGVWDDVWAEWGYIFHARDEYADRIHGEVPHILVTHYATGTQLLRIGMRYSHMKIKRRFSFLF